MSRAAADLVARMERLGATPAAAELPAPAPAVDEDLRRPRSGGGRRRPGRQQARAVRCTVDLDPELHRSLRIFALEQRVDASEVVRALLELLDDDLVGQAVIDRLDRAGT